MKKSIDLVGWISYYRIEDVNTTFILLIMIHKYC